MPPRQRLSPRLPMTQNLLSQFEQLTALLQQTHAFWRPRPFYREALPWLEQQPALAARVLDLPRQAIAQLATDTAALEALFADDLPFASALNTLSTVPKLPTRPLPQVPARFASGIPGRKWQQVQAFAATLSEGGGRLLEWCAGKSHLGVYLAHCLNRPVTALEWNAELVDQANARARRNEVELTSHRVDVLSRQAARYLQTGQRAVALHACGDLHERLLLSAFDNGVERLDIAPCCYHKRREDSFTPLSACGRQTQMPLDRLTLQSAVTATATAPATVRRQRERLQSMRLGFDALQRDVRGVDEFLPVPSLPMSWARAGFADFCGHCARLKGIRLPATNWQYYERLGEEWFWKVSALDLVRFLFRRPLEVWLVLDRALFLREQDYAVRVGTFCSTSLTPRNLMIQAWRT
jgi:hypothetical protein